MDDQQKYPNCNNQDYLIRSLPNFVHLSSVTLSCLDPCV